VVSKGLGSWIWDTSGNKYLDMTAGAAGDAAAAAAAGRAAMLQEVGY
jgi:4-aminobutyrate aminotransferase-like enzyme